MVITVMDVFLACFCLSAVRDHSAAAGTWTGLAVSAEPDEPDSAGQGESARKEERKTDIDGKKSGKEEKSGDGEKLLALTFDDGPHAVYTKRLLEGLRERGVKASFFLVKSPAVGFLFTLKTLNSINPKFFATPNKHDRCDRKTH